MKWSEQLPSDLTSRPPAAIAVAAVLAPDEELVAFETLDPQQLWGDDDYLRLAYQAYAVRQARRSVVRDGVRFFVEFGGTGSAANPEHELSLARLASKWDLTAQAELLWLRVAKIPATRREALDALYQIYRERNDLPNLRLTAQRLHESSPEEIGLATNAARLALLLDRNTAAGRELARQTYEKAPNDTAAAVTYAFALYGVGA